jgi:hypothetical protein
MKFSKLILISIFKRKGNDGKFTMLFTSLPQSEQEYLLSEISIEVDEEPLVVDFLSTNDWVLITSRKIYWEKLATRECINFSDIRSINIDYEKHLQLKRSDPYYKWDASYIRIQTNSGINFSFQFEAGAPFSGLYQLLLRLIE